MGSEHGAGCAHLPVESFLTHMVYFGARIQHMFVCGYGGVFNRVVFDLFIKGVCLTGG